MPPSASSCPVLSLSRWVRTTGDAGRVESRADPGVGLGPVSVRGGFLAGGLDEDGPKATVVPGVEGESTRLNLSSNTTGKSSTRFTLGLSLH